MEGETPKKTKGNILKVVELGIQDRVYQEMRKPIFTISSLQKQLDTEGIHITNQSISKFIRKTKEAQRELISKDLQAAQQLKEITMDYGKALKDILKEVTEVKKYAWEEKDLMAYNQLVARIYQGIELIAKLTGDIQPRGKVDINFIYNQISADLETQNKGRRKEFFKQSPIDVDYDILQEDIKISKQINAEESPVIEDTE